MRDSFLNILRSLRLYANLLIFSLRLVIMVLRSHPDVRVKQLVFVNLRELIESLHGGTAATKTTGDSHAAYQQYGSREIHEYYNNSNNVLLDNKLILMTQRRQREIHLSYIFSAIDEVLARRPIAEILEVGCGNCINIHEISAKYGERVRVSGIDVASNRIAVGQEYFGAQLASARLQAASITSRTTFDDDEFDIVYSMFCLEQISYDTEDALREMYRICRGKVIMLEPVFENGTFLNRIYLMVSDHTRILLKSIKALQLPLVRNEVLPFQFNPSNQSSLLVVDKGARELAAGLRVADGRGD